MKADLKEDKKMTTEQNDIDVEAFMKRSDISAELKQKIREAGVAVYRKAEATATEIVADSRGVGSPAAGKKAYRHMQQMIARACRVEGKRKRK